MDHEPTEIFDVINKIYSNFTMKMSSFFVVVTLVILIWLVIKWFLKMLASLAWLITIVFVTMYILPALREGKMDDVVLIVGNILYSLFAEGKKFAFKLIKRYMEVTTDYLRS